MIRYLLLLLVLVVPLTTKAQKPKKELPKNASAIQIKTNSRNQALVIRNNRHERKDLRVVRMNRTLKHNVRGMNTIKKSGIEHPNLKNKTAIKKRREVMQKKMQKKNMIKRKRAKSLKQQIKKRRTR